MSCAMSWMEESRRLLILRVLVCASIAIAMIAHLTVASEAGASEPNGIVGFGLETAKESKTVRLTVKTKTGEPLTSDQLRYKVCCLVSCN